MMADWLKIEKAALAGVTFFLHDDAYPYEFCFVDQEIDETSMRNVHKLLVIALANVDLLFPPVIFTNDQRPYAFLNEMLNDAMAVCAGSDRFCVCACW